MITRNVFSYSNDAAQMSKGHVLMVRSVKQPLRILVLRIARSTEVLLFDFSIITDTVIGRSAGLLNLLGSYGLWCEAIMATRSWHTLESI